jgi:hypothetical protein
MIPPLNWPGSVAVERLSRIKDVPGSIPGPANLLSSYTRFHVGWNPSVPGVWNMNAAAARTSMSRSLTTGEVVEVRITDSTVSIHFFVAV